MSLSDLASIGNFVSGAAVLVSLIYLGFQVRQAAKHQKAQVLEARTSRIFDLQMRLTEPDLARVWDKVSTGKGEFTEVEFRQLAAIVRGIFFTAEVAELQHQEGLITDQAFGTMRGNWANILRFPAARVLWRNTRLGFDQTFAAEMDRVLARTPVALAPLVADFNRDVAAEIAASLETSGSAAQRNAATQGPQPST